jgi:hypothetical protein
MGIFENGIPLGAQLQDVRDFERLHAGSEQTRYGHRFGAGGTEAPIGQRISLIRSPELDHRGGDSDPLRIGDGIFEIQPSLGVADEIDFAHAKVAEDFGNNVCSIAALV